MTTYTPGTALQYSSTFDASDEPPTKRPKTLACQRCRRRKQKCDDERPCANCTRSGEECHEAPSRPYWPQPASTSTNGLHPPLALLGDIASLEERVSHLEKSRAPETDLRNAGFPSSQQVHSQAEPERERSRPVFPSLTTPDVTPARTSAAIGMLPISLPDPLSQVYLTSQSAMHPPLPELPSLEQSGEDMLFQSYYERVQTRYPFLRLEPIRDINRRKQDMTLAFFANMIFSISLLLGKTGEFQLSQARQEDFYQVAISRYLPHIFSLPDRVLHIQAYLLLAMHALYSPSTERLISITSTAMRYCVMAQLHLADAEPRAADVAAKVGIQLRRRVFWSAYALDRAVSTMFHLPFCIPDYQITTKMYANVDDADLYRRCEAAFPDDPHSQPSYTNISAALHIVYCRQIQSEILNTTLHRDFEKDFDRLPSWRRHILEKLDRWKSLCHRYTEDGARLSLVHEEWLHIVYNYSLLMLYQPNRQTAGGPAGDWTVKACVQTILIFRKFQRESAISEAWMGLIAQFKSGVALLYCFWATQGLSRSAAFDPSEVSEAVRCCSIVLSLLAERWHSTKVLRDAFDILAREVPLVNSFVASPSLRPKKFRPDSSQKLLSLLSEIEAIVVHRDTLRMIREMATEAFPVANHHQQASTVQLTQDAINNDPSNQILESDESPMGTAITGDLFQPVTPHFFTLDTSNLEPDDFDYAALGFPGLFDPTI